MNEARNRCSNLRRVAFFVPVLLIHAVGAAELSGNPLTYVPTASDSLFSQLTLRATTDKSLSVKESLWTQAKKLSDSNSRFSVWTLPERNKLLLRELENIAEENRRAGHLERAWTLLKSDLVGLESTAKTPSLYFPGVLHSLAKEAIDKNKPALALEVLEFERPVLEKRYAPNNPIFAELLGMRAQAELLAGDNSSAERDFNNAELMLVEANDWGNRVALLQAKVNAYDQIGNSIVAAMCRRKLELIFDNPPASNQKQP